MTDLTTALKSVVDSDIVRLADKVERFDSLLVSVHLSKETSESSLAQEWLTGRLTLILEQENNMSQVILLPIPSKPSTDCDSDYNICKLRSKSRKPKPTSCSKPNIYKRRRRPRKSRLNKCYNQVRSCHKPCWTRHSRQPPIYMPSSTKPR